MICHVFWTFFFKYKGLILSKIGKKKIKLFHLALMVSTVLTIYLHIYTLNDYHKHSNQILLQFLLSFWLVPLVIHLLSLERPTVLLLVSKYKLVLRIQIKLPLFHFSQDSHPYRALFIIISNKLNRNTHLKLLFTKLIHYNILLFFFIQIPFPRLRWAWLFINYIVKGSTLIETAHPGQVP